MKLHTAIPPLAFGTTLLLTGAFVSLASLPRGTSDLVLVISSPWVDGVDLVEQAGGRPIGPQSNALATLAAGDDADSFIKRVGQAGAWAILDGAALAALCGWEI